MTCDVASPFREASFPDWLAGDPSRIDHSRPEPLDTPMEMIVAILDDASVRQGLESLDGWTLEQRAIVRTLEFASFADAMAFVNRVAVLADEADHHPDIDIRYRKVRLELSTHSAGGLTRKDFELARRIDALD